MNKNFAIIILFVVLLFSLFLTACAPNEKQVRKQLESANYCKVEADCLNVGPACPFGCQIYINKNEEAKVKQIIDSFDSKCAYGCLACVGVDCIDGKCQKRC